MIDDVLNSIRSCGGSLRDAIIHSVCLEKGQRTVTVNLVTDKTFTEEEYASVNNAVRAFVPAYFGCKTEISKLVPDEELVAKKIKDAVRELFPAVYATLAEGDIQVQKTDEGFSFTINVLAAISSGNISDKITAYLKRNFCGSFSGKCVAAYREIVLPDDGGEGDDIEYEIPAREFKIFNFRNLEGEEKRESAVYLADLNLVKGESVVICGTIEEIHERQYTNKRGQQKSYFSFLINDGTATAHITYFVRVRTEEKIRSLLVGDSIVCTGKNEEWKGELRYTAQTIDYGTVPPAFVPQKRPSKPVPARYKKVIPQPFVDMRQADIFSTGGIPECLKGRSFVVCDIETTGLNSSPVYGNMDKIIEIGAFKVIDGIIKESFSTFINPKVRLSQEIIDLTGITEDMLKDAPYNEDVMPDFFRFCSGSVLVGHNIINFDFKFLDYYCAKLGYILDRKLIDTYRLAQQLMAPYGLSNYKLDTVASKFGIEFNHHRAIDDALATAKIFVELIKIKKSLPDLD